ncbi:hypothetical protein MUK42_05742 [Musa troglodytarum]|uniref:Uncharacterized protein n=1 Tax=Musa troglodytarum TaxID=320322 RepID=A0A9E7HVM6_9LILI|nr:hypothetical protein MUK42_05742 [Musa troglodytarum]URE37458.1 hypothetical protein MUK42_05742 [Musa troglodytarum]
MKRKETPQGEFSCIGGHSCICDVSCPFVDRIKLPPFTTNRWSFLSGWWSWSWKKRGSFDEYETEEIELGMGRTGACRYWNHDISTQLPLISLLDGTFGSEATRCSCHGDADTTTADGIWRRDGALGEPPTAGVRIRRLAPGFIHHGRATLNCNSESAILACPKLRVIAALQTANMIRGGAIVKSSKTVYACN